MLKPRQGGWPFVYDCVYQLNWFSDVQLSLERLQSSSSMQSEDGRIQTAARSVSPL